MTLKKSLILLTIMFTTFSNVSIIEANEIFQNDEFELVCKVVSAEARGEPYEGQMAVVEVIKNRSELWNMTLEEVCTTKNQFAKPHNGDIPQSVKNATVNILYNNETVFETDKPTHFHSGKTPYWVENKTLIKEIGNHKFYK